MMKNTLETKIDLIRSDLLKGKPIIVYDFDGREEEADMVFYAGAISWESIHTLRTQAGGLICYVIDKNEAEELGIDFMVNLLKENKAYSRLVKRPKYGDYPSFSLWVNSVNVKTGISDIDRATTIRELHDLLDSEKRYDLFREKFYSPGHVPILISRGLKERKGHTELVTSLAEFLGLKGSMVIAEMLDSGKSLSKDKAMDYASLNGYIFVEGKEILELFK
jgi:3,4-dihydroxy 2-butanone 4-phosphate synthase